MRAPNPLVVIRQVGVLLQLSGATFNDVYAARAAIEIAAVRTLAERADTGDLEALQEIIEQGRICGSDSGEEFGAIAGRFHRTLVHHSGNATMSFIVDLLGSLTDAAYTRLVAGLSPEPRREAIMKALRSWSKLVRLIETGDAQATEAHWMRHIRATTSPDLDQRPLAAEVLPRLDGAVYEWEAG